MQPIVRINVSTAAGKMEKKKSCSSGWLPHHCREPLLREETLLQGEVGVPTPCNLNTDPGQPQRLQLLSHSKPLRLQLTLDHAHFGKAITDLR